MSHVDLRPLTAAEILDRTFTLFRRNFLIFIGITAVPQILVLAIQLARIFFGSSAAPAGPRSALSFDFGPATILAFFALIVTYIAILFSQAATIFAVTDLYLSRVISISDCLRRAWGEIGTLFGVGIFNSLAVLAGFIALLVPGIYILCRLMVSVPAALVEQRSPRDALRRSWNLTKENAGRAFLLILFYLVISIVAGLLIGLPAGLATVIYRNNPGMLQFWLVILQVGSALVNILTVPILLILTAVFYFDLRVRKEAFDLQFLMDPNSERVTPPGSGSMPSIL